ncbi:hypothetical protein F5X99DRAFT_376552 [Biscogniauxia marginata]|nr:hypothetical protein F5X99DRAFT_376552 [Biscogniauxia marginata]
MMLNPILLHGFLATSTLGAVIGTGRPGFVGQGIGANTTLNSQGGLASAPKFRNTGRQFQLPVDGQWTWGAGEDQCDGTNVYKTIAANALVTDCQWLQQYMSDHPGYYHAFEWRPSEQHAVAIYRTCTISVTLDDEAKDVVSVGSQNIADVLSYVLDSKNGLRLDGDTIGVKAGMRCMAEPAATASVLWIIHETNGWPWDNDVVATRPSES